jgi:hypothetical protein
VQNLDGTCVNYESTTCCSSDQVCMNGIS